MKKSGFLLTVGLLVFCAFAAMKAQQVPDRVVDVQAGVTGVAALMPTSHPVVPPELSQIWLAPGRETGSSVLTGSRTLATLPKLMAAGDFAKALGVVVEPAWQQGPLAQYATYYTGLTQLRMGRAADSKRTFSALRIQPLVGYLTEAAALGEAEASLELDDPADAVSIYERMVAGNPTDIEDVLMRLGRAAKAAGDLHKAADAFGRVYYEFALSELAPVAGDELAAIRIRPPAAGDGLFKLDLGRAERLFGARQYGPARSAYEDLRLLAKDDDAELVKLRLAECDYYLGRTRVARESLLRLTASGVSRRGEALYFHALIARKLGDRATYLKFMQQVASEFPTERWAEEALNDLATHLVRADDDEEADAAFRRLYETYPKGTHAERAAWKVGWRLYRQSRYADAARVFERAAADFPRSDYRPSWLYWAGRAQERTAGKAVAAERYAIVVADYLNSYYGRLAVVRLDAAQTAAARTLTRSLREASGDVALPAALPPNESVVRALLSAGMYDDAINELRYARRAWGDSAAIQATMAWTNQQRSRTETGMTRFQLVRGAINTMRRAYPQYMTAGGEELPNDILTVIFPMAYWDLIRQYSALNSLDPYLVAALVSQESTFVADIRSHANAYGLMQLLPSTARQMARKLGLTYSSRLLTDPVANVRMGTAYFADKIRQFGTVDLALASYNAGELAVRRWMAERGEIEREEFIDDIPYPETQGYVKKILSTAQDYRRLYASGVTDQAGVDKTPVTDTRPAVSTPAPPKKPAAPQRRPSRATPRRKS